jgi:hypothetical protein
LTAFLTKKIFRTKVPDQASRVSTIGTTSCDRGGPGEFPGEARRMIDKE